MHDLRCPNCGSSSLSRVYSCTSFSIHDCSECSLRFKSIPELDQARVQELQDTVYHGVESRLHQQWLVKHMAGDRVKMLNRFARRGRLLEVGCATGEFLEAAEAAGFDVLGVDASERYARYSMQRNLNVRYGRLEEMDLHPSSFDVIALFHVIEHVQDPVDFLRRLNALTREGGLIFIATPNVDSVTDRLFGFQHPNYHQEDHLLFFSTETLRQVLQKASFEPLVIESREHPHHPFTSVLNWMLYRWRRDRTSTSPRNSNGNTLPSFLGRANAVMRSLAKRGPLLAGYALYPLLRMYGRLVERVGGGHELLIIARKRDVAPPR